jgi:hypothetical protein
MIFLIRVDVDKKNKIKIKFTKKRKKLRDQVWGPDNILPINSSIQHTKKGAILHIWR